MLDNSSICLYNINIHTGKQAMKALLETTDWGTNTPSNHTYLIDGTNLVAYIKYGDKKPFYFKNPIKGFDKRGRTFTEVKPNPFKKD